MYMIELDDVLNCSHVQDKEIDQARWRVWSLPDTAAAYGVKNKINTKIPGSRAVAKNHREECSIFIA